MAFKAAPVSPESNGKKGGIPMSSHFRRWTRSTPTAILFAVSSLAVAAPAMAQDNAEAPRTGGIESVTTTARKTEETLIDVPVAVSALTEKDLDRYNAKKITEIGDSVPQLQITPGTSGNGGAVILRGIASSSTNAGIETAVSFNVDGIQISRGYISRAAFFDLSQVEVLKGPQALFFGKNSPAGVVSLRSKGPGSHWEGYVQAGYEINAKEIMVEGAYGGPINDKVGIRAAVRYSSMEGYLKNISGPIANPFEPGYPIPGASDKNRVTPSDQNIVGRLTMQFDPTDRFTATLRILGSQYTDDEQTGVSQVIACGPDGATTSGFRDPFDDCKPDHIRVSSQMPDAIASTYPLQPKNGKGEYFTKIKSALISLDMTYDFGNVNINSVTGFYYLDTKGWGNYGYDTSTRFPGLNGESQSQFSEELRVTSTYDGPVNFVIGGYYENTTRHPYNIGRGGLDLALTPDPTVPFFVGYWHEDTNKRETFSGFGQILWDIVDNLQLTGGVRYTNEHMYAFRENVYLNPAPLVQALMKPVGVPIEGTTDTSNWSPEVTLTWHPAPDHTLYAAYKTGFKSGGISHAGLIFKAETYDSLSFGPETAKGGEIGYKGVLADGTIRLDLNAYYYLFKGLQRSSLDIVTTSFVIRNAASAVTKGVEAEIEWVPDEHWSIRTALTYNAAKFKDFSTAPCFNGQLASEGCLPSDPNNPLSPKVFDLSGENLANAPEFSGFFGVSYDTPIADAINLGLSADVKYISWYWSQDSQAPGSRQPGYAKFNASIRFHDPDDTWEFAVIGRNLTNEIKVLTSGDKPGGNRGDLAGVVERGREVIFQGTYRF
jgi:outer membrane receptor protein involved in Fe transport